MENKMYKVKDFAEKYGISKKTIYDYIAIGKMPAYKIAGILFVDEAEVIETCKYDPKEA